MIEVSAGAEHLPKLIQLMKNHKFQVILIAILLLLFIFMMSRDNAAAPEVTDRENTVIVFYQPGCHACQRQEEYIEKVLKEKHPEVKFEYHDITKQKEYELVQAYFQKFGLNAEQLGTPATFTADSYMIGYESDETSGKQIQSMIENSDSPQVKKRMPEYVDTWFGRVNVFEKSLPVLAITLGLMDGFNPCVLWVLVYMISLIAGLNDKRKIWLIVGTFVLASAILYYLFMTALLNIFLYIGFLRILQLLIGLFAIYIGVTNLKTYFFERDKITCKVSDVESRQKTMGRVRRLVEARISVLTVLGVIGLAFVVNSMEFMCSAALPAVFTGVLAQASLTNLEYHSYILLYVFFFMLNEFILFGTAAFAMNYYAGERLIAPLKLIGGSVILVLGIIMVFFPEFLR